MAEQKNYALTIAIPTYNRLEKLKICLKRLMEQKKIEQIEIIVSDNASTAGSSLHPSRHSLQLRLVIHNHQTL